MIRGTFGDKTGTMQIQKGGTGKAAAGFELASSKFAAAFLVGKMGASSTIKKIYPELDIP